MSGFYLPTGAVLVNWRICLTAAIVIALTPGWGAGQQSVAPAAPAPLERPQVDRELRRTLESTGSVITSAAGQNGSVPASTTENSRLELPAFEIKRLRLLGEIRKDIIRVTAEIRIQVLRPGEWVSVPIALGELHLIDNYTHKSTAVDAKENPDTADTTQKKWRLYGAGEHVLLLNLIGKTRQLPPAGHSLNLNLPVSTISYARFAYGEPVEMQKLPPDSVAATEPASSGPGIQAIEFWGLASNLQISWVDVVPRVDQKPLIQVENRMKLQLTTIPVALSVTQKLEIAGSAVSELRVTIPPGFRRLETRARNQAGALVLNSSDSPGEPTAEGIETGTLVTLRFANPVEGSVTLEYDLELVNRAFPQDVRIQLPLVQDAAAQNGDLDIGVPPGLLAQIVRQEGARQRRVTSETDMNTAALAFQLSSQKSLIVLHVEEYEAQFAVTGEIEFKPESDNVLMTARYSVNVIRGSLLDLTIRWPQYSAGVWQLFPGPILLVTEKTSTPLVPEQDGDVFRVTFPDRQSGPFKLEMKAFAAQAALNPGGAGTFCPEVQSRNRQPVVITTLESDQFSLRPINSETETPLSTVPTQNASVTGPANRKQQSWLHDTPDTPLRFEFIEQAPSVTATIVAGLAPQNAGIRVHQEITYLIEHSDLSVVSFNVPAGILPDVRISGESESLRPAVESATRISFRLPRPRRDELILLMDYQWPVPDSDRPEPGHRQPVAVPLIQPLSSDIVRCETGARADSGLTVAGTDTWKPVYSREFEAAWSIDGPVTSIPVLWERSLTLHAEEAPSFLLSRTILVTGGAITSTVAVFESPPAGIVFQLPEDVSPEKDLEILIDGQKRNRVESRPVYGGGKSREFRLTLTPVSPVTGQSASGQSALMPSASVNSAAAETRPLLLELRIRQRRNPGSPLYQSVQFVRPIVEHRGSPVPGIWIVEGPDEMRVVSGDSSQTVIDAVSDFLIPAGRGISGVPDSDGSDSQIRAMLSLYPPEVQRRIQDRLNEWTSGDARIKQFFVMSNSPVLSLCLVTTTSLMLVSALTCVLSFGLMYLLNFRSAGIPVLLCAAATPIMWLLHRDWAVTLAPYVAAGLAFGMMTLAFHRLAGDRRVRLPGPARSGDLLTVFGLSGFLAGGSAAGRSDSLAAESAGSSVSSSR
jgi:hypothetical protein